jgi:peptidoglycan/xylan/chitin deacetylase (PgdA/CDA1 family)
MKKVLIALAVALLLLAGIFRLSKSRTYQLFGEIVPRVETSEKVVALTFDDGPVPESVDSILEPLKKHGVKGTFFVCGAQLEENPAVASRLVAEGHELGNHSWSHVRMWFRTPSFVRSEFERTDALIRAAGHEGPIHARAPYCKKIAILPWYFARTNRIHVTFDVEPETFPEIDADADRMVEYVLSNTRPGSIVLLHPWYRNRGNTRAALPRIIEGLKARGYRFVTVNELLAMGT